MRFSTILRALAPVAVVTLLACHDAASPKPRSGSPLIPVIGQGVVNERYTSELNVRGSYAYTGSWWAGSGVRGNAVKIWNIASGIPVLVDSLIVPSYVSTTSPVSTTGDVQVSDDGTLLGVATERFGGSFVLYSLADPAHPTLVSQFHSADTDPGVHTAEIARVKGTLYAFLDIDPNGSQVPAKLVVLDLSDPAHPVQLLARVMGTPFVHDVFVRDSLLFTALWDGGLSIWDIGGSRGGNPANPIFISNVATVGGEVHNVWWFNDPSSGSKRFVFVGQEGPATLFAGSSGDIHVVDISTITAPHEVAVYSLPGAGTHNFSVDEASGVLYAAYYNAGVRALDVRGDLSSCSANARLSDGRCNLGTAGREIGHALDQGNFIWGVQWVGNRLYASDMLHGLWVLDVTALRR
ncbi:MAG: LVIVD repeat-containing protein [Gemmatimonadaceae bacterium]